MASLAKIVNPGSNRTQLELQLAQVAMNELDLRSNVFFARRRTYMLDVSFHFEKLGVDRFSLWLLACVDQAAALRVTALFHAFLSLESLLRPLQVAQHLV